MSGILTVVKTVSHQLVKEQPQSRVYRNAWGTSQDDVAYSNGRVKLTTEWMKLDKGWIQDVGYLCIGNKTETDYIEIGIEVEGVVHPFAKISPQCGFDANPLHFDSYRIRCVKNPTGIAAVDVYPR